MSVELEGHGRTLFFRGSIRNLLNSRNTSRPDSNSADVQAVLAPSVVTPAHAIFQDARNTNIRNATFNIYGPGSNTAPVTHSPRSSSPPPSSAGSSSLNYGTQSPAGTSIIEIDSNPTCPKSPFPDPQTGPEIYVHCLKSQNRGYPLWIPSPSMSLPVSYRSSGVRVGDVGIITPEGGFSFIFNVLHEATHPIHAEMLLPEHYVPYTPRRSTGVLVLKESSAMSYLADRSVTRIDCGEDRLKTVLKTSAKQAALLMMPEPVYLSRLPDVTTFRRYVNEHLESWYRFIRGELGWDVENGDLRVVYGCRKTASFGIATVFNDSPDAATELTFSIDESWTEIAGCRYRWHHRGSAEVKAGPSVDENADIRELDPNGSAPVNQCIFVNTLDVTLSDDQWTRVDSECVTALTDTSATQKIAAKSPTSHAAPLRGTVTSDTKLDVQSDPPSEPSSVRRCEFPVFKKLWHPSDILRTFLLSKVPDAKCVAICSEDWGPFMTEDVNDATSFIQSVLAVNDVCEENGMAYLETKAMVGDDIALDRNALAQDFSKDLIEDGASEGGLTVASYFETGIDSLDQSECGSDSPDPDHVKLGHSSPSTQPASDANTSSQGLVELTVAEAIKARQENEEQIEMLAAELRASVGATLTQNASPTAEAPSEVGSGSSGVKMPVPSSPSTSISNKSAARPSSAGGASSGNNVAVVAHRYFGHAALNWDLRDYYGNITRNDRPLSRRALIEPATTPALPFMRITCAYLPWSMKVYPNVNGTYVTVGNVLESLSLALRHNIREKEFRLLKSAEDQRRATRAYEDRYRRMHTKHLYESEKRSGMKRIDFLMGRTQFIALSNTGHRPDEWHLNVK